MEGIGCLFSLLFGMFFWTIELIVDFFKLIIYIFSPSKNNKPKKSNTNNKEEKLSLSDVIIGSTILSSLDSKPKNIQKGDYSEKELDDYCLEDWQKDLVRNGEYDPWIFNEEEPEEDDFYHEDD